MVKENVSIDDPTLNGLGIIAVDSHSNVFAFNVISRNEGGVRLTSSSADDPVAPGSNNNTIVGNIVTEVAGSDGGRYQGSSWQQQHHPQQPVQP